MSTSLLDERTTDSGPEFFSFTVEQIQQMLETGILRDGEPVELIDGMLVLKDRGSSSSPMSHAPIHASVVAFLQRILDRLAEPHGRHARSQLPVVLNEHSAPEPDCAVLVGALADFRTKHPGPADIELLVEVSDTSLRYDRTTKQRLYATAGIPAYWIVNLQNDTVEQYHEPDRESGAYRQKSVLTQNDTASFNLADTTLQVPVKHLFGR